MKGVNFVVLSFVFLLLGACSKESSESSRVQSEPAKAELAMPGQKIVKDNCKVCHAQGINGAPIIGNKKMWSSRLAKGEDALVQNAIQGFGLMPAKGGKTQLSDAEIRQAVQYLMSKAQE